MTVGRFFLWLLLGNIFVPPFFGIGEEAASENGASTLLSLYRPLRYKSL